MRCFERGPVVSRPSPGSSSAPSLGREGVSSGERGGGTWQLAAVAVVAALSRICLVTGPSAGRWPPAPVRGLGGRRADGPGRRDCAQQETVPTPGRRVSGRGGPVALCSHVPLLSASRGRCSGQDDAPVSSACGEASPQEGTGSQGLGERDRRVARHPPPAPEEAAVGDRGVRRRAEGNTALGRRGRPVVEDPHAGACSLLVGVHG